MRIRHLHFGVLVLAALAAGCAVQAAPALTGTFDRTLSVTGPVTLDIRTGSGSIQVRRGSDKEVHVIGHIRASNGLFNYGTEAEIKSIEANPPIVQKGDSIVVGFDSSDRSLAQDVSISYEVTVPSDTRLRSRTGSGNHDIDSIHGPVDAHTGSGNIHVGAIDSMIMARTGSGDIEVRRTRGGDFQTGSGSISVSGVNDALRAGTGSGRITVEGTMTKDWSIHTGSGSVTVRLPPSAAFDLDARSNSRVHVDHPLESSASFDRRHVAGRVRGGGPLLRITTGSGSIRVE